MNLAKSILAFGALCAFSYALSFSVEGKVQSGDAPVDSAKITRLSTGAFTFSAADGSFSLIEKDAEEDATGIFSRAKSPSYSFQNGILHVNVPGEAGRIQIHAFDLNGKILFRQTENLSAGSHAIDLSSRVQSNSRYLLQVQVNSQKKMLLAKSNAEVSEVPDSISVEKSGYVSKCIPVSDPQEFLTVELDTVPVAVILKLGAGSSKQSVEQGSNIVDFSYAYKNCDTVKVEGFPKGLNVSVNGETGTVSISGTATDAVGTYSFKITTVGGYNEAVKSGQIVITEKTQKSQTIVVDGYASENGGTTGGAGGDTVTVSTYAAFKSAVQAKEAKVVLVKGTIRTTDGDGYGLKIASNKTIMGVDSSATIYGGLAISGVSNVIVYNLNIQGTYPNPGPSDGIAVNGKSTNVFLSHLNIWDAEDGNLDITGQASYVTVSYVKFWYTLSSHPHRLNSLIGSGASDHPEDFGYLKVTYHHCWFGTLVNERMPRVTYGNAHIYNNYYTASGNLYCIGVGSYGSALIENNYFKDVKNPIHFMYNVYAYILQRNNKFDNTTGTQDGTANGVILGERYITTDPYTLLKDPVKLNSVPYKYTLDNAADVPSIVQKQVGPHNY